MKRKGFTLVEIMIVVAIIALLAAIAVPSLVAVKRTANEGYAKTTVRTLSTAAEAFATAHSGTYPISTAELTTFMAAAGSFCPSASGVQGYNYTCTMAAGDYTFVAAPVSATTGNVTYTATTGGVLTPL